MKVGDEDVVNSSSSEHGNLYNVHANASRSNIIVLMDMMVCIYTYETLQGVCVWMINSVNRCRERQLESMNDSCMQVNLTGHVLYCGALIPLPQFKL